MRSSIKFIALAYIAISSLFYISCPAMCRTSAGQHTFCQKWYQIMCHCFSLKWSPEFTHHVGVIWRIFKSGVKATLCFNLRIQYFLHSKKIIKLLFNQNSNLSFFLSTQMTRAPHPFPRRKKKMQNYDSRPPIQLRMYKTDLTFHSKKLSRSFCSEPCLALQFQTFYQSFKRFVLYQMQTQWYYQPILF